jgi:hypothetical protein
MVARRESEDVAKLTIVTEMPGTFPQGLKPQVFFGARCGAAKAAPFQEILKIEFSAPSQVFDRHCSGGS